MKNRKKYINVRMTPELKKRIQEMSIDLFGEVNFSGMLRKLVILGLESYGDPEGAELARRV